MTAIDLASALASFSEPWSPLTVATMNDYDVRLVKTEGQFARHCHPETDELFLVLKGHVVIKMDAGDVALAAGQLYVVPRGVAHQPVSAECAEIMLIEPRATVNTGDTPGAFTAERRVI